MKTSATLLALSLVCLPVFSAEPLSRLDFSKAIMAKDAKKVSSFIADGMDVENPSKNSKTPLIEAIEAKAVNVVELLVNKGANCNAMAKSHDAPIHYALWLCKNDSASIKIAIQIIEILLKGGADLEKMTNGGFLPLYIAAHINQPPLIELLLNHGAAIEGRSRRGGTALFGAAKNRSMQALKILIKKGAALEAFNNEGRTPFIEAAASGFPNILKELATHGANMNAVDNMGMSALMHAAFTGNFPIAALLVKMGVSLNSKTTQQIELTANDVPAYMRYILPIVYPIGMTALDLANNQRFPKIAKLIQNAQK